MNNSMPPLQNVSRDDEALADLLTKKMPVIRHLAAAAVCPGLDYDDAVQEGMIGFFAAVGSFSEDKGANFSTYANVCIQNAIFSAVRSASRQKHAPLNGSISIDDDNLQIAEQFFHDNSTDNYNKTLSNIKKNLSLLENQVLELRIEDKSYADIARSLDISEKSVDNALARIRKKLRSRQ
ncbi:MAG: sigma-70 family RNA polymerase sigma factor [Oscillospiraceae bacterium]